MTSRVLLVDDDASICETINVGLRKTDCEVVWRTSASEALDLLRTDEFDAVVTDLHMRGVNGLELCERIIDNRSDVPVIVLTAFGSLESAISAIRAGAYDFINKPVEIDVLAIAIQRAAGHKHLRQEVKRLQIEAGKLPPFDELVGQSHAMRTVDDPIERVAASDATVPISGESGTGNSWHVPSIAAAAARLPLRRHQLRGDARGASGERAIRPLSGAS